MQKPWNAKGLNGGNGPVESWLGGEAGDFHFSGTFKKKGGKKLYSAVGRI